MFDEKREPAVGLSVEGSVAVELDWALSWAHHGSGPGPLADLYRGHPELAERVRSLWGPDEQLGYPGYPEISIVAHQGGVLFGLDAGGLLDRLPELCRRARPPGGLLAESEADRHRIAGRLDRLRSSAPTRRRYVDAVRELWSHVGPQWEAAGRPAVEAAVARRRKGLTARPSWQELLSGAAEGFADVEELVGRLGPAGRLVVVPAFYTRKGMLMDLPGLVMVGVRVDHPDASARARAEQLGRRLKSIAEPTRLAMAEALGRRPMTVSELAEAFGLAQPTVSNHVKMLRDAGLVESVGDGRRRDLVVSAEAIAHLLADLASYLGAGEAWTSGPAEARDTTGGTARLTVQGQVGARSKPL